MPTSSQAMILRNIESDFHVPLSSCRIGSAPALLTPAKVKCIDMNEFFKISNEEQELKYLEAYIHGNKNEIRKKMSHILKLRGYKTVLSYNPDNDTFKWKFYKDTAKELSSRPKPSGVVISSEDDDIMTAIRAKSAADSSHGKNVSFLEDSGKTQVFNLPESILALGFRDPQRRKELQHKITDSQNKTKVMDSEDKTSDTLINISIIDQKDSPKEEVGSTETTECKQTEESWDNTKYEDRCYPATHTCKTLLEKRPLTVCFSLPENEKYSHAEVKDMLVNSFNCEVVSLQFDPLSVRAGDPVVRNRWLAEVSCIAEVDKMVRDGFKLGDVQIVLKTFDEVSVREHNKYLFLEKIRENNRKLTMSAKKAKSAPGILKSTK